MLALLAFAILMPVIGFGKNAPSNFLGIELGTKVTSEMRQESVTEKYVGYNYVPGVDTFFDEFKEFDQFVLHASKVTRTITSVGCGRLFESEDKAVALEEKACQWIEKTYGVERETTSFGKNRKINAFLFEKGILKKETTGYFLVERNQPMPGCYLVMITLYNTKMETLQNSEAAQFKAQHKTSAAVAEFNLEKTAVEFNRTGQIRLVK